VTTLTLPPTSRPGTVLRCRPPAVYVNDGRRRDLAVLSWEMLAPPVFGRVKLVLHPISGAPVGRIEHLGLLPPIGARVLCQGDFTGGGEFRGFVAGHVAEVDEQGERLVAEVEHELAADLAAVVAARWVRSAGACVRQQGPVRFNAGPGTLASADCVNLQGRLSPVFDSSSSARRWTVADAIAYLLAALTPRAVRAPGLAELRRLAGQIDLPELDATNLTAGDAILRAARRGGLSLRPMEEGRGIVFYRPGRQGRVQSVRLQRAGSAMSLGGSNLWQGRIAFRRRPGRRPVTAIGERKRYEATFELCKGWDASLETSRWRDFVLTEICDSPGRADVYRKWVLNEHEGYCGSPWNLSAYDFTSISATDFASREPRRFLPCLSTDASGRSLGVVVEVRLSSEGHWQRWPGPVAVAEDECAVYLGGDSLPGEFLQAAVEGQAQVRVTATIQADAPLTVEVPGDPNLAREVLDCSDRCFWRKVHPGSAFHGAEGLGDALERDDTQVLSRIAQRHAETVSHAMEAELNLGWIDTSFRVGDIIERIDGRGLDLAGASGQRPSVAAVRHDFAQRWTTTLIVTG